MFDFLHNQKFLNQGDIAQLNCDTQCNFMLMDNTNFQKYRRRRPFQYFGGHYTNFPARIAVPHTDNWNIVIDLGGSHPNTRYSLNYLTSN